MLAHPGGYPSTNVLREHGLDEFLMDDSHLARSMAEIENRPAPNSTI